MRGLSSERKPWQNRGSRHARGYGAEWDRVRLEALERDCYLCQLCRAKGRITEARIVDHIRPKARQGTDDLSNLQTICSACHAEKTARENGMRKHIGACDVFGDPVDPEHPWNA